MSARLRFIRQRFPRAAWAATTLSLMPMASFAQSLLVSSNRASATNMDATPHVDHASMHHVMMPASAATVAAPAAAGTDQHHSEGESAASIKPESLGTGVDHGDMSGMDHAAANHAPMAGVRDDSPPAHDSMPDMDMGAMQGGSAPPDARSPDYSEGVGYGPIKPHLHGNEAVGMLLLDQLEVVQGRDGSAQAWAVQGWYGRDENKLWLRSEGEVSHGKLEDGNVEALWNHAISTHWDSQLGVRHDFGAGPAREWAAVGVQGLAPYWFELEATAYVGSAGRTAARFRAQYEVLFTQRLILQPELELNVYGKDDLARRIGSGLSDVQLGLRLRYEIRREFAPYVGINWVRRTGTTADYARADGQPAFDQQVVAGFHIWF